MLLLIFLFGLGIGSFVAALTYRWPHEISISQGRSVCPKCKKQIRWYDNIPLVSYLVLKGKCRNCDKKISVRYFIIELTNAVLYSASLLFYFRLVQNIPWFNGLSYPIALAVILTIVSITWAIFIIDFEHQYIPDLLSFMGLGIVLIALVGTHSTLLWVNLASGLGSGMFLLSIHLLTLGKGMGLGDVKLALFMGTFLGFPLTVVWMFLSFIIGSAIGILLLVTKQTKLKQKIAFGPFLIASFYIVTLYGNHLLNYVWFY